jgi:hypothetical protein
MSFPKYFVTYTLSTDEAGSNMFWHACLTFSEQASETAPIEVKDARGFYSTVPDSTVDPFIKWLKRLLGFKNDLQQSHGHIEREKIRDLDGPGLKGLTFEVPLAKYKNLTDAIKKAQRLEQEAVNEYNNILREQGKPANGHTRWLLEETMVRQRLRERRLYPFHLELGFNWTGSKLGFTTEASRTCKNRALDLLLDADIIGSTIYSQLLSTPGTQAFPRCSNIPIPSLQLISAGDRIQQKTYHNRDWDHEGRLYFAHSPWLYTPTPSKQSIQNHMKKYRVINDVVKRLNDAETQLHRKLSTTSVLPIQAAEWRTQLVQLKKIRESLIANPSAQDRMIGTITMHRHSGKSNLQAKLNAALMSVNPEKINDTFLNRALHNIALRYTIYGLIILAALPYTPLSGVHLILVVSANCLFLGWQGYKAIQINLHEATMQKDYMANRYCFHQARVSPPPSPNSPSSQPVDETVERTNRIVHT